MTLETEDVAKQPHHYSDEGMQLQIYVFKCMCVHGQTSEGSKIYVCLCFLWLLLLFCLFVFVFYQEICCFSITATRERLKTRMQLDTA